MGRRSIYLFLCAVSLLCPVLAGAQTDRSEVRAGNRKFRRDNFKESEIDYRRALVKDSTSVAAQYNLASSLYRQQDFEGAADAISKAGGSPRADVQYNAGDIALQKQDYAAAVEAFRNALLADPSDMDAKENYIYAKKKLEDQQNQNQNQDQQNQDQNQDQNNDQNQDNNQNQDQNRNNDQNQDNQQNQDNNQDRDGGQQPQEPKITEQQAQQMLKAIQAKEKDTQDKVNKEKAALLQSKQKEKNW